jgi:ADP-heptose:LPS heptosyltransferase
MNSTLLLCPKPRAVLLVRDDRLGDFMLAWPAFALLRRALPDARLVALVPEYTASIARLCPSLDGLLVVPRSVRSKSESDILADRLENAGYDAVISFFSHYYTARAFRRANIPVRIAPSVKLARIFHTHRLAQHRSRSVQPEYAYNLDLAAYAIRLWGEAVPDIPEGPYLTFPPDRVCERRRALRERYGIDRQAPLVAVHPGHGGSAYNLTIEGYARLARTVLASVPHAVVLVTAGPDEEERDRARCLCQELSREGIKARMHETSGGIDRFALDLSAVDALIAGSTGPLHLAACLGLPTVGFFPSKRSASAVRWRPAGNPNRHLGITRPSDKTSKTLTPPDENDQESIRRFFLRVLMPKAS